MKSFWPLVIVVVFAILASHTLLFQKGYFVMHDDLQMMRQLEMEKCFLDGQIPCRWVPDMGYGFGFPLFNFYPPLPYLVGEIFRVFGFSFVNTVKIVFALSIIASGLAMYLLAKTFFGRLGGILSAVFYIWAPYHAVDVYVRGAMNEAWALAWFPLILWASYKLIHHKLMLRSDSSEGGFKWIIGLSLSWVALLLSHNLMAMIFAPVFAGWCLLWLWRQKAWKKIPHLIASGILALGLSAFFTIPAILEQKLVHVDTLTAGYYEYIAHFVNLNQLLISRFWGYGPSVWAEADGMSFQIGHLHWILSIAIIALWLYGYITRKKKDFIIPFFVAVGWLSAFMTHSRSTFLWQMIPVLKFVQFPWRFLTLSTLCFSFVVGAIVLLLPKKVSKLISLGLVLGLVLFNWNYFLPLGSRMGALTDEEKFFGAAWDLQRTAGIYDYLPKSAKENPKEGQKILAEVMEGKASVTNEQQGTNWAEFKTIVNNPSAVVRINIFDFPNWRAYIDEKEVEISIPDSEKWGRMYINIPEGSHEVYLKLFNTPVRTVSNLVSLVSWVLLPLLASRKMVKLVSGRIWNRGSKA